MKDRLPIWYHLGATKKLRKLNNMHASECLRTNHNVTIVADIQRVARRNCYRTLRESGNDYIPEDCTCDKCEEDKGKGCRHPRKCCKTAELVLAEIRPKWNPNVTSPEDGLSLTKQRQDHNSAALDEGGTLTFDPTVTQRGELGDAFRAFVDPSVHDEP
ncbi:hypothetical protein FOMPIDRAFT_1127587, partial [Fomitopsis schrenkii]